LSGGTDGSQEIATRMGARVVPVLARGYGNALMGGIAAASGRKGSLFGAHIAEVPITLHPDGRKAHPPHLRTFRDGWRTLRM
jgi:hypothetical protein